MIEISTRHETQLRQIVAERISDRFLDPSQPLPSVDDEQARRAAQQVSQAPVQHVKRAFAGGLIIDLDDTLTTNVPLYHLSRWYMTALYAEATGRDDLIGIMHEREAVCAELLPLYGYTPERWRRACKLYLDRVAPDAPEDLRKRLDHAIEIALGVGEFYAGVERTLAALRRACVPMVLLTKGEQAKQREKIEAHRLDRFFSRMRIVDHKDAQLLQGIADEFGLAEPIVIGDSAASDIAPALAAGMHAVHIDRGWGATWAAEHHEAGQLHEAKAASFPAAIAGLISERV